MRIATLNCNGVRSAARKGLYDWLPKQGIDVLCLQETRCADSDVAAPEFNPEGYTSAWVHAAKKGYSGVAIYSRRPPDAVIRGFGSQEFDAEGRYLEARFGKLSVVSLYLPSGSSGPERQEAKYRFLEAFKAHLGVLESDGRQYLLCGDWNIAHKEIDLKNWRGNRKNSGFLPEERIYLDRWFDKAWVDLGRKFGGDGPGPYTWWSMRGKSFDTDGGWRIDLIITTPKLAARALSVTVAKAATYAERWSDHAPVYADFA